MYIDGGSPVEDVSQGNAHPCCHPFVFRPQVVGVTACRGCADVSKLPEPLAGHTPATCCGHRLGVGMITAVTVYGSDVSSGCSGGKA